MAGKSGGVRGGGGMGGWGVVWGGGAGAGSADDTVSSLSGISFGKDIANLATPATPASMRVGAVTQPLNSLLRRVASHLAHQKGLLSGNIYT